MDRPFSLKPNVPLLLERQYGKLIQEGGKSYIYPRPCYFLAKTNEFCNAGGLLRYVNDSESAEIHANFWQELEERYDQSNQEAVGLGMMLQGRRNDLSFYLNTGMYVIDDHSKQLTPFDREIIDPQSPELTGGFTYKSFSRYTANLNYDLNFGRFSAARSAVHWGPALYTNLVFHKNAVPFNQLSFITRLGPLNVITLYGDLNIGTEEDFTYNTGQRRRIYAHRYEWNVTDNILLGMSEQLILYNDNTPFAFLPVVPLFIFKGSEQERNNNGSLALDASAILFNGFRFYSEFLVDDLQAPTSLFDDYWGNKWAVAAGIHYHGAVKNGFVGSVTEYSRVEPWVYSHYEAFTAQSENSGYPLGNQYGPNSQVLINKTYYQSSWNWSASLQTELIWKGVDFGSRINDPIRELEAQIRSGAADEGKKFIYGIGEPEIRLSPAVSYKYKWVYLEAGISLMEDPGFSARVHFRQ